MRKIQRFYAFFTAAIISLSISLVAVPAYAQQVQAGKMLQESIEATKVSTSAMDQMWVDLFAPDSLLYNQIVKISTILLIFGFFFFMLAFAQALQSNDQNKIMEIVVWGLVIGVLLNNSGAILKTSTMTARKLVNDQTRSVLAVQVGTLTIQDAMQDVILTDQGRDRVVEAFVGCEAKEGDDQWRCFEEGAVKAKAILKEYEEAGFWSPGLRRLSANINKIDRRITDEVRQGNLDASIGVDQFESELLDLLWQSATNSASRTFLKSFQNWFTFGFEFAMLLTGLLGPIAVASSLLPQQPRAIVSWIIAFFSIGMLKLSYNLLIGFAAVYASNSQAADLGSSGFLLMMSIGAPLISIAVAGGGGAAIFFALGKTTAMVATIIPAAGGAAASAMPTRKAAR
ncbi:MAG: hypothetical protein WA954_09345 [Parerythrobacter sp.]